VKYRELKSVFKLFNPGQVLEHFRRDADLADVVEVIGLNLRAEPCT
jgi:hypothetical protein